MAHEGATTALAEGMCLLSFPAGKVVHFQYTEHNTRSQMFPQDSHLWLENSCVGPGHTRAKRQKVTGEHWWKDCLPRGLVRAAYAKPAQRDHIEATGEEMTTIQVSQGED